MKRLLVLAALLFALPAHAEVTFDWVTVGEPGNACDTQSQGCFGAVSYEYRIGKYEVTNLQYTQFLNAVAATDTYGLYRIDMAGEIWRSGSLGSYVYSLNPLTAYAKSKVETEAAVSRLADDGFTPVFLRNATAYGFSPMLRVDLVVNNLLASALSYGEIRIMSDGSPWRPLTHCRDIARAFVAMMNAPREVVHNKAVNIGGNRENYQVRDVADQVQRLLPRAEIAYTGEVGSDPRDYRVKFDLLTSLLPDFELEYTLETGMEELHRKMVEHAFDRADFEGDRFVRLRWLNKRMHLLGSAR